jgi:serine O-acetyltransferase
VARELEREIALLMPEADAGAIASAFTGRIGEIRRLVETDIDAAYDGDPAATSRMEVVMAYPGLYAVTVHRIAHELYRLGVPVIPRIMSEIAHSRTGIDIHPGATIGERFFIDHGTGVVIGETTVIGRNVRIYQGVTLGGLSFAKDGSGALVKGLKRHPNIEDNVVIYANATILGGDTTIGHDSEIGGNVWIKDSVPPFSRVYNKPPAPVIKTIE